MRSIPKRRTRLKTPACSWRARRAANDAPGSQVFVADRFARDWTSVPFLIGGGYTPIPDGTTPQLDAAQPTTLFLWPYEDWTQALSTLTAPRALESQRGAASQRRSRSAAARGLSRRCRSSRSMAPICSPKRSSKTVCACWAIRSKWWTTRHWRLRTLWQTDRHDCGRSDFLRAPAGGQSGASIRKDGDSGDGFYPLRLWQPGDVIIDERLIDVPPQADRARLLIELGVYDRATNQRVKVIEATPPVIDQAILLGGASRQAGRARSGRETLKGVTPDRVYLGGRKFCGVKAENAVEKMDGAGLVGAGRAGARAPAHAGRAAGMAGNLITNPGL